MLLFCCNKSETIHNGRKYGKINNGNHFSLTSQVIRPDPKSQWSALWLTTDGTKRLVSQLYADFLISQFPSFYVLQFALDLQQKLGPSGEQHLFVTSQTKYPGERQAGVSMFCNNSLSTQPNRDIYLTSALSSAPYASANFAIPRKNSICLTRAGRMLPRVIKHPPLTVHNCHSGYHLPLSTIPIFRPLKADRVYETFPSVHLWVVAKVEY